MDEYLAHSARPAKGIPPQEYKIHIANVMRDAKDYAEKAFHYSSLKIPFVPTIQATSGFHDLGKLDDKNQKILHSSKRRKLEIAHEDAGVAYLIKRNLEAALMAYAHHQGLCSLSDEWARGNECFRNQNISQYTNQQIGNYVSRHINNLNQPLCEPPVLTEGFDGLTRRLALSCLVDADHGDTARHYGNERNINPPDPKWKERLNALNTYVNALFEQNPQSPRNQQRQNIYSACRDSKLSSTAAIIACDSPVGTGKTTAIMAHMLQAAITGNLRHIFVVLPYTNIIKQSVEVYRKSLVLPGEIPEEIVAENHHEVNFQTVDLRQLTTLWSSPIIVTTAVQFFETLGTAIPSRLRKLHELPGSGVFIDEMHSAIPTWLWPQVWRWIERLAHQWSCHFVLASGSLPEFWKIKRFMTVPENIPPLIEDETLKKEIQQTEKKRILFKSCDKTLNRKEFIEFVLSKPGPRLVIMNTVQSAAVIAHDLKVKGEIVLHLSTALAPIHRNRIVERIRERLKYFYLTNWTLVATSCVEAGMDFSFRTGFRERCSATSYLQTTGRINRHGGLTAEEVWDFCISDELLKDHPAFELSRNILGKLIAEKAFDEKTATEIVTEAMRREIMSRQNVKTSQIMEAEDKADYPKVSELCRVIEGDSKLVVIDPKIIKALENGQDVNNAELQQSSVRIYSYKITKLDLGNIAYYDELYKWPYSYDPDFLGYMEGIFPLLESEKTGIYL